MPSTSISAEPIIQSTWIRLEFAPSVANASSLIFSPPIRHVEYACPSAIWLAAFSSNSVLQYRIPDAAIGDDAGTSATSPSRRAPSSVEISRFSTSSPAVAVASTIFPPSNLQRMFSISVPWCDSGFDARTTPSTRSLCGVVKHSSVGMFGWQYTPFPAVVPPPAHRCRSANPAFRSVLPSFDLKCNAA